MADISVTLPDGSSKTLPVGSTAADLASSIGKGLAKAAVAATVDGREVDLTTPLSDGASVSLVTDNTEEGRYVLRHSTAHVMAQAVCDLFPGAKYAIGPPIADGFYYDFELPGGAHFTDEDLSRIEARMREIVSESQPFEREELSKDEGLRVFADQPYKVEIIEAVDPSEGAEGGVVSAYRNDGWLDLCRGPHVPTTARLGAFKLMKVAGAYWRGDEHKAMLQRIYGTAWESEKALKEHLHRLEEAERRDHRKLGVELDLFSFPDELGAGLAVWHPKGATVRKVMEDFSRDQHIRANYEFVYSPHIAKSNLWETSGHLGFFAEGMYPPMELEGAKYYPKPMNCPFHILIFKSHTRSYRDLPIRYFEFGTVYRFERSGVLHGLLRTRGFTQDDSHIFCTREQIVPELTSLLGFVLEVLRAFGFTEFEADISTRPDNATYGSDEEWGLATDALFDAIQASGLSYQVAEGEGAFYGPKIDVHVRDAIGRRWQLSTLQVDFQEPQRFDLSYVGADNHPHRPIMIHRALFGSVERFFGILVEHYAGAFPVWLSPLQARVLPVAGEHEPYAFRIADRLRAEGFRADVEDASEKLGNRVRKAKTQKIPYVLVVGDDDVAAGSVAVNSRTADVERNVPVDDFVERLAADVAGRR
jgi:threonyl-tRNA synthetase